MARKRCRFPGNMIIKPDGVNTLTPCIYDLKEIHENVTVFVKQCRVCGHISIEWEGQDDSEHVFIEDLAEEPEDD